MQLRIVANTAVHYTILHKTLTGIPANSPEKISKLLLHMHLGISTRLMHANNSDIESIYPSSSNQHALILYPPNLDVFVWNVYISPRLYVPLFRSWCARLLPVLAAVSRQRSASREGEKVRWRLIIGAISLLFRTVSLSLSLPLLCGDIPM